MIYWPATPSNLYPAVQAGFNMDTLCLNVIGEWVNYVNSALGLITVLTRSINPCSNKSLAFFLNLVNSLIQLVIQKALFTIFNNAEQAFVKTRISVMN